MPTRCLIHFRFFASLLIACSVVGACYSDKPAQVDEVAAQDAIPIANPNLELGAELFSIHCQACHGEKGRGDGPQVQKLIGPRPRDFLDTRMMAKMSPRRAYKAITEGVPRTSMASFDLLLESERWHLAFFVLALGATPDAAERGREAIEPLRMQPPSLTALANLSNDEILEDLRSRELQEVPARYGLAYFRGIVPFAETASFFEFRRSLSLALAHYRRDAGARALDLLRHAYLDQLRPALKVLRLRHAGLALQMDRQVSALLAEMGTEADVEQIAKSARELVWLLDVAGPLTHLETGSRISAAESASLVHSFALDGALLIFLLIVIAGRVSADSREKWAVHIGIAIGLASTVVLWFVWEGVGAHLGGHNRTLYVLVISAIIALVCIPFLGTMVRHYRWPLSQAQYVSLPRLAIQLLLPIAVLARDSLEIIPAMSSIAQSSPNALYGCAGAVVALVALVALLVILFHNLRANAQIVLLAVVVLLVVINAAGSFGECSHALGWLESTPKGYLQSPWISFWPTTQTVLLQLITCTAGALVILGMTLLRVEEHR